jgi:hypothetical protein
MTEPFRELETEEEAAFSALLGIRPATAASANRLRQTRRRLRPASDEMRAWLAMMVESPLAS